MPTVVGLGVVGLTVAAVSLPRIVADGWREFVHEPRFDSSPVSAATFVAATLARAVLLAGALLFVHWTLATVDTSMSRLGLVTLAAALVPAASIVLGPRVVLAVHRADVVPADHPAAGRIAALARDYTMPTPRLVRLDTASFDGANAFTTGAGRRVTVAVSVQLLTGSAELFDHVVSHELAHIVRRHLRWSVIAAGFAAGSVVGLASLVTLSFFSAPGLLAVFVLVLAISSLPFRWSLAWLSRANERQADNDALARAAVDPSSLRLLHVSGRVLLEPTLVARLSSAHPSPAERLELAARSGHEPARSTGAVPS
jgi:Zn-dependent protease with chaperone function